jgi:predicted permease
MIGLRWRSLAAPALVLGAALGLFWTTLALARAALEQPVGFPQAGRLVDLLATPADRPDQRQSLYPADVVALREVRSLADLAAYTPLDERVLRSAGEPQRLSAHRVESPFFAALGVPPRAGRYFSPAEVAGDERVAVLAEGFARRLAGSAAAAVGRRLELDGESWTAVGVFPAGLGVRGGVPDLFLPLRLGADAAGDRRSAALGAIARLADGATLAAARGEAAAIEKRLPAPEGGAPARRFSLEPLARVMTRALRPTFRLALLAAACGLAFAAVSAALALGLRSRARDRERAVRVALGARPLDVLAREGGELAALAGATVLVALAVARLALRLLPDLGGRWLYSGIVPRLDFATSVAIAGLALAAAVAAGLPALGRALATARRDPFRAASRDATRHRGERALVASQVGLAVALAAVAATAAVSLVRLERAPLGFDPAPILALRLAEPEGGAPLADRELAERLAALPGVVASGASNALPGQGWGFHPTSDLLPDRALAWTFELVDRGYFTALGVPLRTGRTFDAGDRPDTAAVMVINDAARRELGPRALGARLSFDGREDLHEVVGVVGDVAPAPGESAEPIAYLLREQHPRIVERAAFRPRRLFVRLGTDPAAAAAALRAEVAALAPRAVVDEVEPLARQLDRSLLGPRMLSSTLAVHAGIAIALGFASLANLLRLLLARRRRELALRIALGATAGRLRAALLREAGAVAALGALAGWPVGRLLIWSAGRAGLTLDAPADAPLAAVGALAVVAAIAVAAPLARRALRTPPAEMLRIEGE